MEKTVQSKGMKLNGPKEKNEQSKGNKLDGLNLRVTDSG